MKSPPQVQTLEEDVGFPLCANAFEKVMNPSVLSTNFGELNYHDQEIRRTPTHNIQEHWTAVSAWLGLISSVYRTIHHYRSNQRPQNAVPKLYNWATSLYRTSWFGVICRRYELVAQL